MSMNVVFLQGRLVSDPRIEEGAKYGFLTMAVRRDYKNKETGEYDSDFIDVMVTGEKTCELYRKHFHKGDPMIINGGRLQVRTKELADGKKEHRLTLVVSNVEFPLNRSNGGNANAATSAAQGNTAPAPAPAQDEVLIDDDDLPF